MAKNFFYFALLSILFSFIAVVVFASGQDSPEETIATLNKAIDKAEKNGDYKCCIEPACTMCYLGHWKFEAGTCFCDDAIRDGRQEDVCPECNNGLDEGACNSVKEDSEICLIS